MDKTRQYAAEVAKQVRQWLAESVINGKKRVVCDDSAGADSGRLVNDGTVIGSWIRGNDVRVGHGAYVEGLSCQSAPGTGSVEVGEGAIVVGVEVSGGSFVRIGKGACLMNCRLDGDYIEIGDNSTLVSCVLEGSRSNYSFTVGRESMIFGARLAFKKGAAIGKRFVDIYMTAATTDKTHNTVKIGDNVLFANPLLALFPFSTWKASVVHSSDNELDLEIDTRQKLPNTVHSMRLSEAKLTFDVDVNIFNDCIVYAPAMIGSSEASGSLVMSTGAVLGWIPKRLGSMFTTGEGPRLLALGIRIGSHGVLMLQDSPERPSYGGYWDEDNKVTTVVINDYGRCILALRNRTGEYIVGKNGITYGG